MEAPRVHRSAPSLNRVQCVTCATVWSPTSFSARGPGPAARSQCHALTGDDRAWLRMGSPWRSTAPLRHNLPGRTPAARRAGGLAGPAPDARGAGQCGSSCHAMQQRIQNLDIAHDPHRGTCGMCHNPHTQTGPQQVTCTSSACHGDWRRVSFHRGVPNPERCTTCHQPARLAGGREELHPLPPGRRAATADPPRHGDPRRAHRERRGADAGVGGTGGPLRAVPGHHAAAAAAVLARRPSAGALCRAVTPARSATARCGSGARPTASAATTPGRAGTSASRATRRPTARSP